MRSCPLIAVAVTAWLLIPSVAVAWDPDPGDPLQARAAAELDEYMQNEKVRAYLEKGYGYAILPNFFRVAAGLGFNYGRGLVVEQDELVGMVTTYQGTIGFTYGVELHSQIILFRDAETMRIFQRGRFEFQGRANGVLLAWGGAANPGFLPEVAIYSRTKGGVMLELAAIVAKYNYRPLN